MIQNCTHRLDRNPIQESHRGAKRFLLLLEIYPIGLHGWLSESSRPSPTGLRAEASGMERKCGEGTIKLQALTCIDFRFLIPVFLKYAVKENMSIPAAVI